MTALRYNQGKPELSQLAHFLPGLQELARHMSAGRAKYSDTVLADGSEVPNFVLGGKADSEYLDAAFRHLLALAAGEEFDPELGTHHGVGGVVWNMLALYTLNRQDLHMTALTPEERQELVDLYVTEAPISIHEVAARTGRSRTAVRNALLRAGVDILPAGLHNQRPIAHGGNAGYNRCRNEPGGACDPCKEAHSHYNRHVAPTSPEKRRAYLVKSQYGLEYEEYLALREGQGDRCAICDREHDEFAYGLVVDHNHTTGKVRGLLCGPCNTALGSLQDSPALLERAAAYLRQPAVPGQLSLPLTGARP